MPKSIHKVRTPFQQFVRSESFSGLLLITTAIIAFVWANSPWGDAYQAMKATEVGVTFGAFSLHKALILWVNDLLMAIFFLMVGLEIKRELKTGELADPQARALPIAAAIGGMVVPALCYLLFNWGGDAVAGWGIPMATDIAFALGIMALLGDRVPVALKVFLTALAIVDDLGAVTVIALFYTENVDVGSLIAALLALAAAFGYRAIGGRKLPIFLGIGLVLWYFMLKSGVHATVAGVALAFAIPLRREIEPSELSGALAKMFKRKNEVDIQEAELAYLEKIVDKAQSPLHELEHGLQPWVAYAIMPIFALFNAGFVLGDDASLLAPVSLGVFVGLIVGKPIGILGCSWIAVAMGKATLPDGIGWRAIFGTSMLAGIGFTMSLFIAALAFSPDSALDDQAKLGVLAASVVAAVIGLVVLAGSLPKSE
ncbi:MAG: Na+/H+ antiporter NhaA, partial [Acidobacteriota bacterium]